MAYHTISLPPKQVPMPFGDYLLDGSVPHQDPDKYTSFRHQALTYKVYPATSGTHQTYLRSYRRHSGL